MPTPYVYERQTEYWTSRQVEESLLDAGFEVLTFPLTQITEHRLPADYLFFSGSLAKLFGFQYKALYKDGKDGQGFWPVDEWQHRILHKYPWVSYCFSELRSVTDHRLALHLSRIAHVSQVQPPEMRGSDFQGQGRGYQRWGAFFQRFRECREGTVVTSEQELRKLLMPDPDADYPRELVDLVVDVFVAELTKKHVVHLSPLLSPIRVP